MGRREDRVPAEEVDLRSRHRVAEPPEQIDVVPALLRVAARRVVLDAHLVEDLVVEALVERGLQDRLEHAELRDLLALERVGVVEDLAVAVAEDVRREPARHAEEARLEAGRDDRLHEGLARLEVLAGDRHAALLGELPRGGEVDGQVRRAVRERHALEEAGPRVDLRVRDAGVVVREALFERALRLVHGRGRDVDLGRPAPHGDGARAAVRLHERADVGAHGLDHLGLLRRGLHVRAVEAAHVVRVEDGRHRLDLRELVLHEIDVARLEHLRVLRRLVRVVREHVPAAEDELIERRERDELADLGGFPVGALADADGPELGHRADRRRELPPSEHAARDEGRRHGTEAGQEHAERSVGQKSGGQGLPQRCRHCLPPARSKTPHASRHASAASLP